MMFPFLLYTVNLSTACVKQYGSDTAGSGVDCKQILLIHKCAPLPSFIFRLMSLRFPHR